MYVPAGAKATILFGFGPTLLIRHPTSRGVLPGYICNMIETEGPAAPVVLSYEGDEGVFDDDDGELEGAVKIGWGERVSLALYSSQLK